MTQDAEKSSEKSQGFWDKLPSALCAAINLQLDIDDLGKDEFAEREGITYEHISAYTKRSKPRLPNKTHEYIRLLRRLDADQMADALRPLLREKGLEVIRLAGSIRGKE